MKQCGQRFYLILYNTKQISNLGATTHWNAVFEIHRIIDQISQYFLFLVILYNGYDAQSYEISNPKN